MGRDNKYSSKEVEAIYNRAEEIQLKKLRKTRKLRENKDYTEKDVLEGLKTYGVEGEEALNLLYDDDIRHFQIKGNLPPTSSKTPKTKNIFHYPAQEYIDKAIEAEKEGDKLSKEFMKDHRGTRDFKYLEEPMQEYILSIENLLEAAKKSKHYAQSVPEDIERIKQKLKPVLEASRFELRNGWSGNQYNLYLFQRKLDDLLERLSKSEGKSFTSKLNVVVIAIGFLGTLFFLSVNLTGNVISTANLHDNGILGISFLLIGLVGTFFYFKRRKFNLLKNKFPSTHLKKRKLVNHKT